MRRDRRSVVKLGGGATVADLLKALTAQPSIIVGSVNVTVQGKADDPAATARAVRSEFIRETRRSAGREGPTNG